MRGKTFMSDIPVPTKLDDELTFFFRIFVLPFFICYLLAVDYLILARCYREALTIAFNVFTINCIFQSKYLKKVFRKENNNESNND